MCQVWLVLVKKGIEATTGNPDEVGKTWTDYIASSYKNGLHVPVWANGTIV